MGPHLLINNSKTFNRDIHTLKSNSVGLHCPAGKFLFRDISEAYESINDEAFFRLLLL